MSHTENSVDWYLTEAVILDDLAKVKELLTSHGLPSEGYPLLLDAVKLGRTTIVNYLVERGLKVNSTESKAVTLLRLAIANGQLEVVQTLLEASAAVDASEVLLDAVKLGRTAIVKYLVERGAKVNNLESKVDTPLYLAIARGELEIVQTLLEANAVVDAAEGYKLLSDSEKLGRSEMGKDFKERGATANVTGPHAYSRLHLPVHLACEKGCVSIVKFLLEPRKEYMNYLRLEDRFRPLHSACENGQLEVVGYLLSERADPNVKAAGNVTPLHLAAKGGLLKVVDLLCKNGANVEARTSESLTPLLLAAKNGREDVVKLLLYRGACVNASDKKGNTPLFFAVENRSSPLTTCILQFKPDIDEEFLERICDSFSKDYSPAIDDLIVHSIVTKRKAVNDFHLVNAVCKGYEKTVEILLAYGVDPSNSSLLHLAVEHGHHGVVQMLLNAGCIVNSKNKHGKTPIYYLFKHRERSKYFDICKLMLSRGADVKENPDLLHEAVMRGCVDVCRCLIENGADVNATGDIFRARPLEYTVECESGEERVDGVSRGETAKLLLKSGANVSTTLHDAAGNGYLEVVLALLEFQADINAKNEGGLAPLHFAAAFGHKDIVQILMKNGADVDTADNGGKRPLHLSANGGHAEIVKLLLHYYADVNAQDANGRTALHRAFDGVLWDKEKPHHQVITILFDNGSDVNIVDYSGSTALSIIGREVIRSQHELRYAMVKHILKQKAAGLFINDQNEQLLHDRWLIHDDNFEQFKQECSKEVERMKQVKLCCHLKLHDVLVNPSNPAFVANESVISSLESINFSRFPIYHSLLQNKSKKSEEINKSKKWLNVLIKTGSVLHHETVPNLPAEVLQEIISYLDRKDLRHLIACGEALKRQLC